MHSTSNYFVTYRSKVYTTAEDLLDELTLLPIALKREYQQSIKKEMNEVESRPIISVRHVFHHLINPISTFLDYKLLEHLISRFGTPKLKQDMELYVADVRKFKQETTVAQLMDHWDSIENQSLNYTKLKMHLGEDPTKCTLEDLDKYRKKFCSIYKLSELVMILINLKHGSFVVVWRIPKVAMLTIDNESISLKHTEDICIQDKYVGSLSLMEKQMYW